ncbi:MAG TPA: hypothetical protein PK893_05825 [Candidatus Competibacteraceae bacterium]|nr:hypothetical protein [Candidatus Competibacteraceae bacterium]
MHFVAEKNGGLADSPNPSFSSRYSTNPVKFLKVQAEKSCSYSVVVEFIEASFGD